ncbi:MAG: transposase [Brevinema sp.]
MLKEFKSLLEIVESFKTEQDFQDYFSFIRWGDKLCCPYCNSDKVYKLSKGGYKCISCDRIYTVKIGTLFENSKLPLKKWFIAIFLLSTTKKGIS